VQYVFIRHPLCANGTFGWLAKSVIARELSLKNIPQQLKPPLILVLLLARLKPCPFKTGVLPEPLESGVPLVVFMARRKQFAEDRLEGRRGVKEIPQGLKPLNFYVAITAWLKPCPCYKACVDRGQNGLSASSKVALCYESRSRSFAPLMHPTN
jgi:hypothetical protein